MGGLADEFRDLAAWADGSDPLYAHLCRHIAEDHDLLELAKTVPTGRQAPHLLLAAVQYLLDRNGEHRLSQYYPTLTDTVGCNITAEIAQPGCRSSPRTYSQQYEPPRKPDDNCYPAFREFCLENASDLRPILRTRRTQTNSVRRSAVLYPAIAHVAARTDDPIAIVELGSSAGLNLLFDRYRYDYDGRVIGSSDAPFTIESEIRGGDPPLPESPPDVHSRVGIDLNPLDVVSQANVVGQGPQSSQNARSDDADWLRALVWPSHTERRRLLEGALQVASTEPPRLVEGDLRDDLPAVLDDIPDDVPVCVLNTLVLYQVPESVCVDLEATLCDRMGERPLHWLTGAPELSGGESITLDWVRREAGEVCRDRLVESDPHGVWLDWR